MFMKGYEDFFRSDSSFFYLNSDFPLFGSCLSLPPVRVIHGRKKCLAKHNLLRLRISEIGKVTDDTLHNVDEL